MFLGRDRYCLALGGWGLAGGDVLAHGFDFDGEVCVGGGVEVADGDHADELIVAIFGIGDWDVTNFAIGHEVADFSE